MLHLLPLVQPWGMMPLPAARRSVRYLRRATSIRADRASLLTVYGLRTTHTCTFPTHTHVRVHTCAVSACVCMRVRARDFAGSLLHILHATSNDLPAISAAAITLSGLLLLRYANISLGDATATLLRERASAANAGLLS